jgi:hypothetical protein
MPPAIATQSITFENNRKATAAFPATNAKADDVVSALDVRNHKAVLLLIGGAGSLDARIKPQLTQLFARGIARAATNVDAAIIDGGTEAGVMKLMGQGVADCGFESPLIGVAPLQLISYPGSNGPGETPLDHNHSHFVLVDGRTWGSETNVMFRVLSALTTNRRPVMAVLAGGGETSKAETLQAVRQHVPLLVIDGSGGVADEIAAAWKARPALPEDPLLAEIIAEGKIDLHLLDDSVKNAERFIVRSLGCDNVLLQAWESFADYDLNAMLQQRKFDRLQHSILIIGVLGTFLIIATQVWAPESLVGGNRNGWWWVNHFLIAIPILLTILLTAASQFKQGNKWLFLRAGAESIKREIYRYRTRTNDYLEINDGFAEGTTSQKPATPAQHLARKLQDITQSVMATEVSSSALIPYDKARGLPPPMSSGEGGDDGFSLLTPDRYVNVRLEDQLDYYKRKAARLSRILTVYQWLILIVGGVGTYLAVVSQQVWIAVTTAIVAALTSYLGYTRTEDSLTKYNQAKAELANIKWWWTALSPNEKASQEHVDLLVDHTEKVLAAELDNWVQLKQNGLAELRKNLMQPGKSD